MQLLYALGIAILLVLLFQGARWLREHQRRLRVKLEKVPAGSDVEDNRHPELGKVRVRARFDDAPEAVEARRSPIIVVAEPPPAVADDIPVLQAVPVPVEAAPEMAREELPRFEEPEPASYAMPAENRPEAVMPADDHIPVLLTPAAMQPAVEAAEQQDMFADEPIMLPPSRKPEPVPSRASVLYEKPVEPVRAVAAVVEEEKPYVDIQDVIALHVVARQDLFNGEDLLRSILAYGLRFGEMSIFHRHEQPTGQGRILFSMAKAVEPGTFDLEAMTGEEIPGVSFFLSLPGINSIHAYDIMVDTVKRLATDLNGEVLDEQQQVLTRQLIEHYRERVQEFERRRLMNRPAGH
ncbi:MAG: cell division protein ZipA [Pedobacter sp.]|nr:cell division protein ZipA [Pedobacter sp.]